MQQKNSLAFVFYLHVDTPTFDPTYPLVLLGHLALSFQEDFGHRQIRDREQCLNLNLVNLENEGGPLVPCSAWHFATIASTAK